MTTLHLGVIDVAYGWAAPPGETTVQAGLRVKRRKKKRTRARSLFGLTSAITTGDVATILEDKYHLMESFYQVHEKDIGNLIVQAVAGRLENIQLGAPTGSDAFGTATNQIEDMFKKFLSTREVEHLGIPGVPTKAAQEGVSHRFLHPYAKRGERPSFIDTSLYVSSFKSWVD